VCDITDLVCMVTGWLYNILMGEGGGGEQPRLTRYNRNEFVSDVVTWKEVKTLL
jgi:hypothetical protein